jgi:hypothetical protein
LIRRLLPIIPLLLLGSCFSPELEFEDQYLVVVEAYLYSGSDLAEIRLTSMISFGNDSTGGEGIDDAVVTLSNRNGSWILQNNPGDSGRYYPAETIQVEPGDTFSILIEANDEILRSRTVVPQVPPQISLSAGSIYIPRIEDPAEQWSVEFPDPIELTWDNPAMNYYFFKIENIQDNPESIMPDPPDDLPFARGGFVFQLITRPVNGELYSINMRDLTHFGTHRIIVFSVNQEYVELYETQEQDTRKLNEPYSNIENGLGIFTSFSSDTLYFEVIPIYN